MDPSLFDLCPDACLEYGHLGNEGEPLLQIDSFIQGASLLRDYAVGSGHFNLVEKAYPGIRLSVPLLYSVAMAKNLRYLIDAHFGLDVQKIKSANSRFSIVTTPPEKLQLLQRIPHIDAPSKNGLAVVHYLVDAPNSGTALYRHRATGFEYVDQTRHEPFLKSIQQQFSHPASYPKGYICGDTPEFEVIASFEAKFNRMIMYRGSSLHSGIITPDYNFDPNPATGRLTITSFFEFHD